MALGSFPVYVFCIQIADYVGEGREPMYGVPLFAPEKMPLWLSACIWKEIS